jgi:uncharacterized protein (DUF1684 family)
LTIKSVAKTYLQKEKMKNKLMFLLLSVLVTLSITSCNKKVEDPNYVKEIISWHEKRIENLTNPTSWLSLVGLHWLKQGENTFGSDRSNDLVFTKKAPPFAGSFFLNDSIVTIKVKDGVEIMVDSTAIDEMVLLNDISGTPTLMTYGTLSWYVIKRSGNRYGIRVKDSQNDLLVNFEGIDTFPISKDWRIEASFEEYNPPKTVLIPNIIGGADEDISPGKLTFKVNDKDYSLDMLDSGSRFFVIFADMTNGEETYGAGRFLSVEKPDSTGKTFIDFNKAYNPPCAFTKYATCPLPPKDNMLKVAIEAGEKSFGKH